MPILRGRWAARRAMAAAVNDTLARADRPSRLDLADWNTRFPRPYRNAQFPRQRAARADTPSASDTVAAMLIAFSVAPSGIGERSAADPSGSVSEAVAEAVRVVRESGLPNSTDAMFTTVEGEWDECMAVVKKACDAVGRYGSRVSLVLKADIRPGWNGQLTAKVDRVEDRLRGTRTDTGTGTTPPPSSTRKWDDGTDPDRCFRLDLPALAREVLPPGPAAAPRTGIRLPGLRRAGDQRLVLFAATTE